MQGGTCQNTVERNSSTWFCFAMKLWAPDAILLSSIICKRQVEFGSLKVWSKNEMR